MPACGILSEICQNFDGILRKIGYQKEKNRKTEKEKRKSENKGKTHKMQAQNCGCKIAGAELRRKNAIAENAELVNYENQKNRKSFMSLCNDSLLPFGSFAAWFLLKGKNT